ncbi:unnamed protein product [Rodentolepis nana]|uniref:IntS14_C domain-containing protein n=1 Tax=Rodentolepis nana TaxID=102285 RepID=A0A0R3T484_RODNA|nr:unnamed protein product [Rodentolepis nana]
MPWLIAIDWAFQSLRKLPTNAKESYFEYSQSIVKSLISNIHTKDPYDLVSVLIKSPEDLFEFAQFSDSRSSNLQIVDSCPHPNEPLCLKTRFTDALIHSVQSAYSKFTSCQHIRLVVLTDGYRDFVNTNDDELKIPEFIRDEITCIVINHSGCQVPFRLKPLKYNFTDFHNHDNKSLTGCNEVADSVMKFSSCEISSTAILSIGHLSASCSLLPSPCIRPWKHINIRNYTEPQFYLEAFGFLQVNDMGHPPIVSRYTMVYSQDKNESGKDTLKVLLASLKGSHTTAIVNIYIQSRVDGDSITEKNRKFITHGFISESPVNVLSLSFFGEESKAVAWLGPFDFLASSGDFEGHEVYNVEKKITPFPVGSLERPSYILPAASSTIGSEFQYSTWLNNTNGPSADVNKIFRLCKRLPEKSEYFLKELHRTMSLAEVLGWTELTQAIQSLLPTHLSPDLDVEMLRKVYHTARMKVV